MTQRNTPARGATGLILLLALGLAGCGESDSRAGGDSGSPGQPGTPRELHCAPDPSALPADDSGVSGIARTDAGCGGARGA